MMQDLKPENEDFIFSLLFRSLNNHLIMLNKIVHSNNFFIHL